MKRLILIAIGILILSGSALAKQPKKDVCSQGDFAVMLSEYLWDDHEESGPYTIQQAVERLTLVEITPTGGWKPEAPVTRQVLQDVLAELHAHYNAQKPAEQLTKAEVEGMLREQIDALERFRRWRGKDWAHRVWRPYYPMPAYTK
ncbi:MAG: hypothetical protein AB1758_19375 [Candidatus Eremiobacterota bacterium]